MTSNPISKAKLEATMNTVHAFYVDFMPIFQEIQKNLESLKDVERDYPAIAHANEKLSEAMNLLTSLNKHSKIIKDNFND